MEAQKGQESIALCLSTRWRCVATRSKHFTCQGMYAYAQEIHHHKRHWMTNKY
jgi:hypothetical protein